jgi:hypothetical protein
VRRACEANGANMIFSARVWKRPATDVAQRMRDELNIFAATRAEIGRIPSVNTAAARAAAWRIEPIHDPIKTIGKGWSCCKLHEELDFIKTIEDDESANREDG